MQEGVCIDPGHSAVLQKGTSYYLFPNGTQHFYVSKFPNWNAHKGCFQAKYFQIIEKELWPEEPEVRSFSLDPEKVYKANLIWRKQGYKSIELKEYFVRPRETHGRFYQDGSLKVHRGSFPLHWFTDFLTVDFVENVTETTDFVIEFDESEQFLIESEPLIANYEQLSLFDF
ncbi:hypothetical protein ACFVSW_20070 [Neobacillus sp. NPDC058068]|uniref:hypothetical protein n=1 Tax=Neobacillus sp. NPDC058068 TaxID=3346325 RepID=UPI0036D9C7D3